MTTPTVKSNLKLFIILEPFETTQQVKIRLCPYTTWKSAHRFGAFLFYYTNLLYSYFNEKTNASITLSIVFMRLLDSSIEFA